MRVVMQKVAGIASVKVSLNDGLTILDFKPDNTATLGALRQVIRNNGFVTNESQLVARGAVTAVGNGLVLEVKGSGERLMLRPAASNAQDFEQLRARLKASGAADVVLSGMADTRDPKAMSLTVRSVSAP